MQNSATFFDFFSFALSVTAPAYALVLAGLILRRLGLIGDRFISWGSKLVFNVGMPVVLFFGAARADYSMIFTSTYLIAGVVAMLLVVVLAYQYARLRGFPRAHQGIIAQGAYRSNMGIVGIALCANAYGDVGVALAAVPIAIWTTLYNVIAVVLLNISLDADVSPLSMLKGMLTNPLIVGICSGIAISVAGLTLPSVAFQVGSVFTAVFLPFALLCIGGSLSLAALRKSSQETIEACAWRLVLAPVLAVLLAVVLGVRGVELGVYYLLVGGPAAAASFVMVVAAGGNGTLAANIVVLSTIASSVTVTVGMFLLQALGLI